MRPPPRPPSPGRAGAFRPREEGELTAHEQEYRSRPTATQLVADFLATFAIVGGVLALVYYPGRVGTAAVFVALLAAALGGSDRRLVPIAVWVTAACWCLGMILAIALERPIV
jgi:hypothetical protein